MKKISACRHLALLALVIAGAGPSWATAESSEIPLMVGDRSFDAGRGAIRFSIINTSDKIVTAWGFTLTAGDTEGTEQILGWAEDFFLTAVLDETIRDPDPQKMAMAENGPLVPGSRRFYERSLSLRGPARFHVVSVKPTFAIFADQSSAGDPASIGTILADRAGSLEASSAVLKILESLNPRDSEAMADLIQEVTSLRLWAAEEVRSELMSEHPRESDRLQFLQSRHAFLQSIEERILSLNEKARDRPFETPDLLSFLQSRMASERESSLNSLRETSPAR